MGNQFEKLVLPLDDYSLYLGQIKILFLIFPEFSAADDYHNNVYLDCLYLIVYTNAALLFEIIKRKFVFNVRSGFSQIFRNDSHLVAGISPVSCFCSAGTQFFGEHIVSFHPLPQLSEGGNKWHAGVVKVCQLCFGIGAEDKWIFFVHLICSFMLFIL